MDKNSHSNTANPISLEEITFFNSIVMTIVLIISIFSKTIFLLPMGYLVVLLFLIWKTTLVSNFFFWRTYANTITLSRFLLTTFVVLAFKGLSSLSVFFLLGFSIFLDGVDGWVARRFKEEHPFGATLDMITDAFFVLIVLLLLIQNQLIPFWLLIIGFLHYGYELILKALNWQEVKTPKNRFGKLIAVVLFISLLGPFILSPDYYLPLLYLTALLTCCSFGISFWDKYRNAW